MSWHRSMAIAERVVRQVLRDRRSLGLILVAPLLVMALVGGSFSGQSVVLDRTAPALIATFAMFFTFMLTGVSFLRERSQGTLERLVTTPVSRADILVGYLLGFLLFALVQSTIVLLYTVLVLDVAYQGDLLQVFVLLMVLTIASISTGIFVATFARNEFQVVQFIPVVLAPQVFVSGIMVPVETMPTVLRLLANVVPLRYAVDGMRAIMLQGLGLGDVITELAALAIFAAVMLVAAAFTVRRT
jgi:ABC-2 type transport system permease protein